jgi:hypothetical protein
MRSISYEWKIKLKTNAVEQVIVIELEGRGNMTTFLELFRIIFIFGLLGGLSWTIVGTFYIQFEVSENYSFLGGIAIFLILFVLYRNKLQFSGWYKGKGREKLSKTLSLILILSSLVLIISPLLLSSLFN